MKKVIVALSGVSQSGKDTYAVPLIKRGFMHGSFAHNLKEMCQQVFHLPPSLTDTQEGKKKRLDVPRRLTNQAFTEILRWMSKTHELTNKAQVISNLKKKYILDPTLATGKTTEFKTAREILQIIGTDICREIISSYHIDVLIDKIKTSPNPKWVISDCRFPDEREALRELGALTVLIQRPSLGEVASAHISENSFGQEDEYDVIVVNNSTIEDLQKQADVFNKL